MKGISLLSLVIFCLPAAGQQSIVRGFVSIHNSETNTGKRQYVANAQVEDDFGKANPRLTDNEGQFGLVYVGVPEKVSVSFQVKKQGLQVVDPTALSAVSGQQELVKVSMAHPDSIAEYRRRIFNIGKTEAEKRLERLVQNKHKELGDLRRYTQQNAGKIKKLEQELSNLEEQRKRIAGQAEELARKYAPVNLDDASALFREAFVLFQGGKLDSALMLLRKANLAEKVYSILLEREKIQDIKNETQIRDSIEKQRTQDVGEALRFKTDLHKTRFEFDSVLHSFELLIKLDSANAKHLFDYAFFLDWLNQHDKAIAYYTKALGIYLSQAKTNPKTYKLEVAKTQNNLGILYGLKKDFVKAEAASLEALQISERLAKTDPQTYELGVAFAQNNLGALYWTKNDTAKAEAAFMEALEIRKRLAKTDPQIHEPSVAKIQNNLGGLYIYKALLYKSQNTFAKAEAAFLEALRISERLAKTDPQIYEPDLAMTQNNLGALYWAKNEFAMAEAAYLKSLEIRKRLAKINPQTYEPELAKTQDRLGYLYVQVKDFTQAEKQLVESFLLLEKWMNQYPEVYSSSVSQTAITLLNLYTAVRNKAATDAHKAALPVEWKTLDDKLYNLAKRNKNVAETYSVYYGNYSWYALLALKFKDAENAALKAYEVDSTQVWIKTNKAHALLFQNRYAEALQVYSELKPLRDDEGKTYAAICLEDLDALEKAGVTHKDVNKIRAFLKE